MALISTASLSSLISETESPSRRSARPQKVLTISRPAPTPSELDALTWDTVYNGPLDDSNDVSRVDSGPGTPTSEHPTPFEHLMVSEPVPVLAVHSWSSPPGTKYRVLTCCLLYFTNGLNDSALGALIPLIETHYDIDYTTMSLIFISTAIGFLLAAPMSAYLHAKLGQARLYVLSELCMCVGYAVLVTTPPYAAVVAASGLLGWAIALNLALSNVYCANLAHSTVILGAAQGAYGIGGVLGPIVATSMTSGRGWVWSRYYILTLIMCLIGAVAAGWSFQGYEKELEAEYQQEGLRRPATDAGYKPGGLKLLVKALKYRATFIGALFTFVYQGAEVAISGWTISFLITERSGNPAHVGYVTAGFWAGITLGRFTLSPLAARLGERPTVLGLGFLAMAFQLLVWLVPNVIGDSIAVSLVGFVLGPLAPVSMVVFARLLPKSVQTTAMSFVSSGGSSGGAVWPFVTGLIAQSKGTYVLHPICLGLFVVMVASWWSLPEVDKRDD